MESSIYHLRMNLSMWLLSVVFVGLLVMNCSSVGSKQAVRKEESEYKQREAPDKLCTLNHQARKTHHYHHAHLRRKRSNDHEIEAENVNDCAGNILLFNGSQAGLRLKERRQVQNPSFTLPRHEFSASIWIQPEGGQAPNTLLLGLQDVCNNDGRSAKFTWHVGIKPYRTSPEKDARFYCSLKTETARKRTTVWAHMTYTPLEWFHLVITYTQSQMLLYLNGARVGRSMQQAGPLYSEIKDGCKRLVLAPVVGLTPGFRGQFYAFHLWTQALSHAEVASLYQLNYHQSPLPQTTSLVVQESFNDLAQWHPIGTTLPRLVACSSQIGSKINFNDDSALSHQLRIPHCGHTVCDDPRLIKSYAGSWELRRPKTIRYRVINIIESDGTNASVSGEQIAAQHAALNKAFRPSNISFKLELVQLHSTLLRRKTILLGCDSTKIGNGQCDEECHHTITEDQDLKDFALRATPTYR